MRPRLVRPRSFVVRQIGPEVRRFAASRPAATQPQVPPTPEQRRQMAEATVATQFETITAAAQGSAAALAGAPQVRIPDHDDQYY